jgi:formate-dependent nitrite reductase cytochrome c552 subunit
MPNRTWLGARALGMVLVSSLAAALAYSLEGSGRRFYLPGPTTVGHYQIELACDSCHTAPFSDRNTLQAACIRCHGPELVAANDSHPEKKFADPRNAERVSLLDARFCVTCHREHRPELVSTMGLSLPQDYCQQCHQDIAQERPTHAGLGFETCASAGCHNFHDNRALYEDFLLKHLDTPAEVTDGSSPSRQRGTSGEPLAKADADGPPFVALSAEELSDWEHSAHARGGVNCRGCHSTTNTGWANEVGYERCGECHAAELDGFAAGRHGMRLAVKLAPLRVADARLAMKPAASERTLGCTSCHGKHSFDTRAASVESCLGCHDDEHSRAYRGSAHEREWLSDAEGRRGASCATCHMPRVSRNGEVSVVHNQNDNLRPNEKMVRDVCLNCHGLEFSLEALADTKLVQRNFRGQPETQLETLTMVKKRNQRN